MRELITHGDDGPHYRDVADEGKYLLFGYDMDCVEWCFEGTLDEVFEYVFDHWSDLRMDAVVGLTNSREEHIRLDIW